MNTYFIIFGVTLTVFFCTCVIYCVYDICTVGSSNKNVPMLIYSFISILVLIQAEHYFIKTHKDEQPGYKELYEGVAHMDTIYTIRNNDTINISTEIVWND